MKTGRVRGNGAEFKYSVLEDNGGRWMQFYYTIVPDKSEPIADQMRTIERTEADIFKLFEIETESVAVRHLFSSDLINHREQIAAFKDRQATDFYFSLTEQPPVSCVKIALLGMCLSNITSKVREDNVFCCDTTSGIRHIFLEHLVDPDPVGDSAAQTRRIFTRLREKLSLFGTSIEDGVLRTWLYAPHVDADYGGIVNARKELFDSIDLTENTHYIASTGIQGGSGERFARVSMDAYAVTGIDKNKIRYIHAPDFLCPTHLYGVTFERATAVELGSTDFLFISGTASIDSSGEIVHPGDVVKQTKRTLTNISALLDSAGFAREDLSSFIVYLRDATDFVFVKSLIENYVENLPTICVKAPVCRPGWLIEIEATAARFLN